MVTQNHEHATPSNKSLPAVISPPRYQTHESDQDLHNSPVNRRSHSFVVLSKSRAVCLYHAVQDLFGLINWSPDEMLMGKYVFVDRMLWIAGTFLFVLYWYTILLYAYVEEKMLFNLLLLIMIEWICIVLRTGVKYV